MKATLLRSLGLFVLIYVLLSLPLPALRTGYCALFRDAAEYIYGGDRGQRSLTYAPSSTDPYETQVTIANRSLLDTSGGGPVWNVDIDTMALGWQPTALLTALILATPIPFRRRLRSLALGLFFEQALIAGAFGYFIWVESSAVSLVSFTPFWNNVARGFATLLKDQIGFGVPIVIWILATFRRSDFAVLSGK